KNWPRKRRRWKKMKPLSPRSLRRQAPPSKARTSLTWANMNRASASRRRAATVAAAGVIAAAIESADAATVADAAAIEIAGAAVIAAAAVVAIKADARAAVVGPVSEGPNP